MIYVPDREKESDDRLIALAERAFHLGLLQGRAIVRPISRDALLERLELKIMIRPKGPNQVTFEESAALRTVYGAGHHISAVDRLHRHGGRR